MKLLDGISNWFRHPKRGYVYAVTDGDYLGEFLVYVEEHRGVCMFLSLPDMHIREILQTDVKSGLDSGVLDPVEKLPSDVYSVCCEQYSRPAITPGTEENVHSNTVSNT